MYNCLNCPQVMGLVLAGLFTALGLEASEYWRSPATEKQQATLDRGQETDRVSSQTLSTQTTAPEETETTATWVDPNNTSQTGSLLPPHLHENWTPVALNNSKPSEIRDLEYCVISMAQLSTEKSPLYVRSHPEKEGEIVGELETGRWISIMNATDQWFEIIDPTKGWVQRSDVASSCNEKVERLNLGPRQASVSIQEEMVGVGVHRYVVHVPPGKTLTLKNVEGTIPRILSPDGELLSQPWDTTEEGRPQWIGEPIASGDYTIEVVSHDAQLQYALSVEITPLQEYAQILNR
ncbi:SH3 domain-containing protein [Roseofilum sp. BLCC_M91]|uniref:SH3 domain-containing protein n=1 Tax=Roseofilum halophilum BLCC-M91 TaxID=3022259 RepID=A0ABT7BM94_9CYAN|nr:SH3 domain-containing protein [Roseofilum halophilum]MDJ1180200.1 SH3 domain-containing protein [Roseofilum halophilum BLCC-M91]